MTITFSVHVPNILAKEKVYADKDEDIIELHELIERRVKEVLADFSMITTKDWSEEE